MQNHRSFQGVRIVDALTAVVVSWPSILGFSSGIALFGMLLLGSRASGVYQPMGYYTSLASVYALGYAVPPILVVLFAFYTKTLGSWCHPLVVGTGCAVACLGSVWVFVLGYEASEYARKGAFLIVCGWAAMCPALCGTLSTLRKMQPVTVLGLSGLLAGFWVLVAYLVETMTHLCIVPTFPLAVGLVAMGGARYCVEPSVSWSPRDVRRIALGCGCAMGCGMMFRCIFHLNLRGWLNSTPLSLGDAVGMFAGVAVGVLTVALVSSREKSNAAVVLLYGVSNSVLFIAGVWFHGDIDGLDPLIVVLCSFSAIAMMGAMMSGFLWGSRKGVLPRPSLLVFSCAQLSCLVGFLVVPTGEFLLGWVFRDPAATEHLFFAAVLPCMAVVVFEAIGRLGKRDMEHMRADNLLELATKRWGFTSREAEVFVELARGRTAQPIADRMCVSINTVRSHIKHVYTKLGVHSQQELIDWYDRLLEGVEEDLDETYSSPQNC